MAESGQCDERFAGVRGLRAPFDTGRDVGLGGVTVTERGGRPRGGHRPAATVQWAGHDNQVFSTPDKVVPAVLPSSAGRGTSAPRQSKDRFAAPVDGVEVRHLMGTRRRTSWDTACAPRSLRRRRPVAAGGPGHGGSPARSPATSVNRVTLGRGPRVSGDTIGPCSPEIAGPLGGLPHRVPATTTSASASSYTTEPSSRCRHERPAHCQYRHYGVGSAVPDSGPSEGRRNGPHQCRHRPSQPTLSPSSRGPFRGVGRRSPPPVATATPLGAAAQTCVLRARSGACGCVYGDVRADLTCSRR